MKSSTGKYYIALDHVRAIAMFMVFTWHFIHVIGGQLAPPPVFPLSLLTEGHTGVSLFLVLSGYLFAKLLDGKQVIYLRFLWNRILRLAPMLVFTLYLVAMETEWMQGDLRPLLNGILTGFVLPTLPHGGWSITTEFHFYLLLPGLLFLTRKWKLSLLLAILAAIGLRTILYEHAGEIQSLGYWTLVGRFDQFTCGILAFQFRHLVIGRHRLVLLLMLGFAGFYHHFDSLGGYFLAPFYPSPYRIWIILPTVEGIAYAAFIAWYDGSFSHSTGRASRFLAAIGKCSYSIYLLHFFFVFRLATWVHRDILDLSNLYVALLVSVPAFLLMVPIGMIGFRLIESPFLRYRTHYLVPRPTFDVASQSLGSTS